MFAPFSSPRGRKKKRPDQSAWVKGESGNLADKKIRSTGKGSMNSILEGTCWPKETCEAKEKTEFSLMPSVSTRKDSRKDFLVVTAGNYFGAPLADDELNNLYNSGELNNFLDDVNCFVLCGVYEKKEKNRKICFTNKPASGTEKEKVIVFFKIRPEVITPDNIHTNIFVSSMVDSPVSALYHSLQKVFAPMLLQDDKWSQSLDPTLQTLMTQLEFGLGSVLRHSSGDNQLSSSSPRHTSEDNFSAILTLEDEKEFWMDESKLKGRDKSSEKRQKRGVFFADLVGSLAKDFSLAQAGDLNDVREMLENTNNTLDDIWKADDHLYPQKRMLHLLDIAGNCLTRLVQSKLSKLDLWKDPFPQVDELLNQACSIYEKWSDVCQKLTSVYWPTYGPHLWEGGPYVPNHTQNVSARLKEVLGLRLLHKQLTRLLSVEEQQELRTSDSFRPFSGLNAINYNPYTEPLWRAAVMQFDNTLVPVERKIAKKLQSQLQNMSINTLQLLHEFKRYQELIRRGSIRKELVVERQNLLGLLIDYIKSIKENSNSPDPEAKKLPYMPDVVCNIYWYRQLEAKVKDIKELGDIILSDLPTYDTLYQEVQEVLDEVKEYGQDQYNTWAQDKSAAVASKKLGLSTNEAVVHFDSAKMMRVNYNQELVQLMQEVRQLAIMGYRIPPPVLEASHLARKFVRQAKQLEQVSTFHNVIGERMILSQRPMMLEAALQLSTLVRDQQGITWDRLDAVDAYITRLQDVVDTLSVQNEKLTAYHVQVREKVIALMSVDLLRHQNKWKESLKEIRAVFNQVEAEGFKNLKSWQLHWDRQLYKSLEYQYQLGLEALNEHLPEIKVELHFKEGKLQFRPPMEEIRMKYYGQLKRFLAIPCIFKGVGEHSENKIFGVMVDRNAHRFSLLFQKAENLFQRLDDLKFRFFDWVALGTVDLDKLAEQHLKTADDWDRNFRVSKMRGQEIAKLPTAEEKIDCFSVTFSPVRFEIEIHNRKYWDTLSSSLQSSIIRDVSTLEKFFTAGMETLKKQPEMVEEIGEANAKHAEYMLKAPEMEAMLIECHKKNHVLSNWTKDRVEYVDRMSSLYDSFKSMLENYEKIIGRQVDAIKTNLQSQIGNFMSEIERFQMRWDHMKPKEDNMEGNEEKMLETIAMIKEKREEWNLLMKSRESFKMQCSQFGIPEPDFTNADETEKDLERHEVVWLQYEEFNRELQNLSKEEWIVFRGRMHLFDEYLQKWHGKLKSETEMTPVKVSLIKDIERYKSLVPAMKYVRGDSFGEKHWSEMFSILDMTSCPVEQLTLGHFLKVRNNIPKQLDKLKELNSRATGEVIIRQALGELDVWEIEAKFNLIEHRDSQKTNVMLITDFKDIINKIGDNQSLLQSVKTSPYYKYFSDRASIWETRLADLDEYMHNLNQIQRRWVYLEPIFGRGTLSNDQNRFKRVDEDFKYIMIDVARDNRVVSLCKISNLRSTLTTLLDQLSRCQKSLNEFLEKKRSSFPRFYFVGDDDLLEILGQSTKPQVIQSHLKKLFAGIYNVEFDSEHQHITAMLSLEGERVKLNNKVRISPEVEEWLNELSTEMRDTLKSLLMECLGDGHRNVTGPDPNKYPSQILCLGEAVMFSEKCEEAISSGGLHELMVELKGQLEAYTNVEMDLEDTEGIVLELKLKALVLDIILYISIVEQLIKAGVKSVADWAWQKQLRFYLRSDGVAVAKMVDAEFQYTYEYQGNAPKLVHTPLTDKCYLTLTQGMHMGFGGNPYGPAGTGKTESVKALGGLFGRQVLVFNCDEGIDVRSMGRIFVGLVKCGAWGCFDEFNRLEEATLSAVSMQIQPIQTALKTGAKSVRILDEEVALDPNSGIFVTLNPAGKGYGGRQKLPDNLKQLFRPVVMSKPDNDLIAEVILYTEGFKHARSIGHKLVEVFRLSGELLSPQQHYDWGLRALKTVLKGCGTALKEWKSFMKREGKDSLTLDENKEAEVVVRALRLNTLSKLTSGDSHKFDALVKDVFPGCSFSDAAHGDLWAAVQTAFKELGLEESERQQRKCMELHEQLQQRMGVVVVGPSGSGKTSLIRVLRQALLKTGRTVKQYTINPKAMPRTQLLGQIDLDTRQWKDGVLTISALQVYGEPPDVTSWIVCDGDIDPEWVESLNSVLDDNRLLTLPSGWRIQFGPNVNFIFETHDLSYASPATISRMGMIFLSDEELDVKSLVKSWLGTQETATYLQPLLEDYFYRALDWVRQGELAVPVSLVGLVFNGLSQLHGITSKAEFAVQLIRGLGGNIGDDRKAEFAKLVLSWTGEGVGDDSQSLNTYYDQAKDRLEVYRVRDDDDPRMNEEGQLPLIKTVEAQRTLDNLRVWLQPESQQPFLLVGPEGCGKSMMMNYIFAKMRSTQVATIHCSAQITPQHVLQKLTQMCMTISTNTGRVYRPKDSERLIMYFKDLNLVKPDKWGTCQLIEFLQQVLTYKGFYDNNLEWVGLEGILIVGSMTGGNALGRHPLSPRFTSIVRISSIGYPDNEQLKYVYNSYLSMMLRSILPSHPISASSQKIMQLASSMIQVYEQARNSFTVVEKSHYLFTPRELTLWTLGLLRYDLGSSMQALVEAWAYEANRLFRDKLANYNDRSKFDGFLSSVLASEWSLPASSAHLTDEYYVTPGAASSSSDNSSLVTLGKPLGRLSQADWKSLVERAVSQLGRESRDMGLVVIKEVLDQVAAFERVLSRPGGSLLLAGRSGVGRRSGINLVALMHDAKIYTLKTGKNYGMKQFKVDLKAAIQMAAVEGSQVYLVLEDHQIVDIAFLDMVNSLLSSGEIPGLYTPEELEPIISPLRDIASQEGFSGSLLSFFAARVHRFLHVVMIMDYTNHNFVLNCESNPAFYKQCSVHWLEGWSQESMRILPMMFLNKDMKSDMLSSSAKSRRKVSGGNELIEGFLNVHQSVSSGLATPRRYVSFIHSYMTIYINRKTGIEQKQKRFLAGVAKLTEAKELVDRLKSEAIVKERQLAEKQAEANAALEMITETMRNANTQKVQMEDLKGHTEKENDRLMERKKEIDLELAEIEPLVKAAQSAVGNIKNEALSEIRSLRAPPDVIRDILEGVLCLMGILDTSWNSMKSFLAKRGVKEEIRTFDARTIDPKSRDAVEKILAERKDSFNPTNAKRASAAAAPLASWVVANVKFSFVLEKIKPLEKEQSKLQRNLKVAEDRIDRLSSGLEDVDKTVATLRNQLNKHTKEAAEIELGLSRAKETLGNAEGLVGKLSEEHERWKELAEELGRDLKELPAHSLLAGAFVSYLSESPEDVRRDMMKSWSQMVNISKGFDVRKFLSSERQMMQWQTQGLPSDELSLENAVVVHQTCLRPFLIDPSSRATEWLKESLKEKAVEVTTQQDEKFSTTLELSVRFGKVLIIQEVDSLAPVLYPLLRGDLQPQGLREVVQIGDKLVDHNSDFRMYLTTRNPNPILPPEAAAVITLVNFTTTRTGLRGQLLAAALQHEKPELEVRKNELLKQEEDLKIQLDQLGEALLQELANAQGNILENKELVGSLNKAKASSNAISHALSESVTVQKTVDQERDSYLPLAEFGSRLFFVIGDLAKANNMYQFSLGSFMRLFEKALRTPHDGSSTEMRIQTLQKSLQDLVFQYISRSLFKADCIMFALHMVHGMYPDMFGKNEWEAFTGQLVTDFKLDSSEARIGLPKWIDADRTLAVSLLKSTFPSLYSALELDNSDGWSPFCRSNQCEQDFPPHASKQLTLFQQVLLVQALRPDRLRSAMTLFAKKALGVRSLVLQAVSLKGLLDETVALEPILLMTSEGGGADPSEELRELAESVVGSDKYHEVAMGQGQAEKALEKLRLAATVGHWVCLKNLHLVTFWLPILEKEIKSLVSPNENFRLWLTSQQHPGFSPVLAQSCLKVTYEAPQGIKKNLERTYNAWRPEYIGKDNNVTRAQSLFALAWFHAVVQERRTYIPQGWCKFYEFNDADLRAASEILDHLFQRSRNKPIKWDVIHGLYEQAIYGGRVDNEYDSRVLGSYLHEFFNSTALSGGAGAGRSKLGGSSGIVLPQSSSYQDYQDLLRGMPDHDRPDFFGLPLNMERSWQKVASTQVVGQLRAVGRRVAGSGSAAGAEKEGEQRFDRETWQAELSPVLNLWKKLNQGVNLIQAKISSAENPKEAPLKSFIHREQLWAAAQVQSVHRSLASLSRVIRGTTPPNADIQKLATDLLRGETPDLWQKGWEGSPEEPMLYLRTLMAKAVAIQSWNVGKAKGENYDISNLFHPDTFLSALKQQTTREYGLAMDDLRFECWWGKSVGSAAKLYVGLSGLQLEGCGFDGNQLVPNAEESSSVTSLPICLVAWVPQESQGLDHHRETISLPLYFTAERQRTVTSLKMPYSGDRNKWIQTGAAIFLKQ